MIQLRMIDSRRSPSLRSLVPGEQGIFVNVDDLLAYLEESKPRLDQIVDEIGQPMPSEVLESVIVNLRSLALDGGAIMAEHSTE